MSTSTLSKPSPGPPVRRRAAFTATLVALPLALAAGLGVFTVSGGFERDPRAATGPVRVEAPDPGAGGPTADAVCSRLLGALPTTLAGRPARPVSAAADRVGAWGDPAVVLRCGVAAPAVAGTTQLLIVDGVTYVTREEPDVDVWTTVDRTVPVEVRIPGAYRGGTAQDVLTTLARPLLTAVPAVPTASPAPSPTR